MERKNVAFEQLSDIMAFRVTVDSVADCYAALGALHGAYHTLPGRFKDYISTPKSNGYRSLHTTIIGPRTARSRSRSAPRDARAGRARRGRALGLQAGGRDHRGPAVPVDQGAPGHPGARGGPEEFLEHTKLEMFQDQVFCFTPKGDLIALPRGATPVDFAYAVHSQVGDRCVGAKIDGRMVQLRTQLHNGDQVEIVTSKNPPPRRSGSGSSSPARRAPGIRRHLRAQKRDASLAQGPGRAGEGRPGRGAVDRGPGARTRRSTRCTCAASTTCTWPSARAP
jgi:GTP pyrophosphokinase